MPPHRVGVCSEPAIVRAVIEFTARIVANRRFHASRQEIKKIFRSVVRIKSIAHLIVVSSFVTKLSLPIFLISIANAFRVVNNLIPKFN